MLASVTRLLFLFVMFQSYDQNAQEKLICRRPMSWDKHHHRVLLTSFGTRVCATVTGTEPQFEFCAVSHDAPPPSDTSMMRTTWSVFLFDRYCKSLVWRGSRLGAMLHPATRGQMCCLHCCAPLVSHLFIYSDSRNKTSGLSQETDLSPSGLFFKIKAGRNKVYLRNRKTF